MQISSYQIILLVAAVISFYVSINNSKYFPWFLGGCVIFELIFGKISSHYFGNNYVVFNFYSIYCSAYYFYFFYRSINPKAPSRGLAVLILAFVCFSAWNMFCFQGFYKLNNYTYVMGMALVTGVMFIYFYHVIKHSQSIVKEPGFWLGAGILLFYSSSFPFLLFLNEILETGAAFYEPLYNLVFIGNHFLCLSYLMVVLCPLLIKRFSKESLLLPSSSR